MVTILNFYRSLFSTQFFRCSEGDGGGSRGNKDEGEDSIALFKCVHKKGMSKPQINSIHNYKNEYLWEKTHYATDLHQKNKEWFLTVYKLLVHFGTERNIDKMLLTLVVRELFESQLLLGVQQCVTYQLLV